MGTWLLRGEGHNLRGGGLIIFYVTATTKAAQRTRDEDRIQAEEDVDHDVHDGDDHLRDVGLLFVVVDAKVAGELEDGHDQEDQQKRDRKDADATVQEAGGATGGLQRPGTVSVADPVDRAQNDDGE